MDVTILELHLPEAVFNAPFSAGGRGQPDASSTEQDEGDPGPAAQRSGRGPGNAVVGLLVLVAVVALIRHLRSTDRNPAADEPAS